MAQWETAQSTPAPASSSIPFSRKFNASDSGQLFDNEFDFENEEDLFQQEEIFERPTSSTAIDQPEKRNKANRSGAKKAVSDSILKGLKKRSLKKAKELNMPPTPTGHDWHLSDGGWNLVKSWSEKDSLLGQKIKKERYAGYLSREAWEVMKEYEYEKIIAKIGQ